MKPVIYPYKMKSESAKMLARELNTVRVSPEGKFRNNYERPIVNWGCSTHPMWMKEWWQTNQVIINTPDQVKRAANKLASFRLFKDRDVSHPDWTTEKEIAEVWKAAGETILVRKLLTAKGGEGIVICGADDELPDAPLYTVYFKKKEEYRVHVFDGKVIDAQQKKKERDNEEVNNKVRNHDNGWVFCREGVVLPEVVSNEAIKAVRSLGLTFGAVDVGYNVHYNSACVFEVNTAPGLTETTAKSYATAIKEFINKENVQCAAYLVTVN